MGLRIAGLVVGLLLVVPAVAQLDTTTIATDTLMVATDSLQGEDTATLIVDSVETVVKIPWPNPSKASYLSLALPGLGQFYNKDYWKIPLVYGAIAGSLYTGYYYQREYRIWNDRYQRKLAYEALSDSLQALTEDPSPRRTSTQVQQIRDDARRSRDFWYFMGILSYALNSVEAYVAAHLKHFDVSDDLSLRFQPGMQTYPMYTGLGLAPSFGVTFILR